MALNHSGGPSDLDALAFTADQGSLHAAVVHSQDPTLANELNVFPRCQSSWHGRFLADSLGGSFGMEKAEHHISFEDVKIPSDHRFTFQDLYNYLNWKTEKSYVQAASSGIKLDLLRSGQHWVKTQGFPVQRLWIQPHLNIPLQSGCGNSLPPSSQNTSVTQVHHFLPRIEVPTKKLSFKSFLFPA